MLCNLYNLLSLSSECQMHATFNEVRQQQQQQQPEQKPKATTLRQHTY